MKYQKTVYIFLVVCMILGLACLGEFIDWRSAEYRKIYQEQTYTICSKCPHIGWFGEPNSCEAQAKLDAEKPEPKELKICPGHNEDEINKVAQTAEPNALDFIDIIDANECMDIVIHFGDNNSITFDCSGDELLITGDTDKMSEGAKAFFEEFFKPYVDEYIKCN